MPPKYLGMVQLMSLRGPPVHAKAHPAPALLWIGGLFFLEENCSIILCEFPPLPSDPIPGGSFPTGPGRRC
jgi:hypothetical protein